MFCNRCTPEKKARVNEARVNEACVNEARVNEAPSNSCSGQLSGSCKANEILIQEEVNLVCRKIFAGTRSIREGSRNSNILHFRDPLVGGSHSLVWGNLRPDR